MDKAKEQEQALGFWPILAGGAIVSILPRLVGAALPAAVGYGAGRVADDVQGAADSVKEISQGGLVRALPWLIAAGAVVYVMGARRRG